MDENEIYDAFNAIEESYRKMEDNIYLKAPICHFQKMHFEVADTLGGGETSWWECPICGHTKNIK